ncbi:MAG: adenylosuccinate synthase [Rhabdochlamydiaceae bacterium]|nr:adenylosuccinate synthase [Rhabdochlamydiaceae bacterium]
MQNRVIIVVGIQWGDEGKGKIIDLLSAHADVVVRCQGGNNAGHTIVAQQKEFKFHLIPSGVLYPNVHCYVAGGCVVDAKSLILEIQELEKQGISLLGRLHVSAFAHLIMPYHKDWDLWQEERKGHLAIGTTRKGIGPCYADKASRIGIQVGELVYPDRFREHLHQVVALKNQEIIQFGQKPPIQEKDIYEEYLKYASFLQPYISFTVEKAIVEGVDKGKKVLLEGAHGSYLDCTFGTYPYVTATSALASGIAEGAGVGPTAIDHVIGVVKAFTTRVGHGPFPTELSTEEASLFLSHEEAREVATTTKRLRRMGWFDVPLVRNSLRRNGASSMAIMKLDVLDKLAEIKVCIAYQLNGKRMDFPEMLTCDWEKLEPVYETFPGWLESTEDVSSYEKLPLKAIAYLEAIERLCNCPISLISCGPQRERTIYRSKLL